MLVLTREIGQKIVAGEAIVTVLSVQGSRVRLGIDAPRTIAVDRWEIHEDKRLNGSRRQQPLRV